MIPRIPVSNSMNKLFTKIINSRISKFLCDNNFGGEVKERRLIYAYCILQKYVKQKKSKIYTAIVDFHKYIDSINITCRMYKLIKCGVTGKMCHVIKASYQNPLFCIKTNSGLSDYFTSHNGVKQGCILSPLISNIFQNDLHECFDESFSPVTLNNSYLSSFNILGK